MNCAQCAAVIETGWKHCAECGAAAPSVAKDLTTQELVEDSYWWHRNSEEIPNITEEVGQENQPAKSTTNPLVALFSLVVVGLIIVFAYHTMQAPNKFAESFPSQESVVADTNPSSSDLTANTEVIASNCGNGGEPIPEIPSSCQYSDGETPLQS